MSYYCNIKDKVLHEQRNHVIFKIKCPGCNGCYIGKTERCFISRTTEHCTKQTELLFKRLSERELCKDCCWLHSLSSLFNENEHDDISLTSHF